METLYPSSHNNSDYEFKASVEDWKHLLGTRGWKDVETFIQDSIEIAKDLLVLAPDERGMRETDETLRGGIKVLRKILSFPHEQLEELEDNDRRRNNPSR